MLFSRLISKISRHKSKSVLISELSEANEELSNKLEKLNTRVCSLLADVNELRDIKSKIEKMSDNVSDNLTESSKLLTETEVSVYQTLLRGFGIEVDTETVTQLLGSVNTPKNPYFWMNKAGSTFVKDCTDTIDNPVVVGVDWARVHAKQFLHFGDTYELVRSDCINRHGVDINHNPNTVEVFDIVKNWCENNNVDIATSYVFGTEDDDLINSALDSTQLWVQYITNRNPA